MTFFLFKLWSEFARRKDAFARSEVITALRDWKALLISGTAIMALVAVGNAYLYFKISKEELFEGERKTLPAAVVIDQEELRQVIKEFEERAGRFDELSQQAPRVADPSIPAPVR